MAAVQVAKETLEVPLMARCSVVVGALEFGVFDVDFAVFAPVFWLFNRKLLYLDLKIGCTYRALPIFRHVWT